MISATHPANKESWKGETDYIEEILSFKPQAKLMTALNAFRLKRDGGDACPSQLTRCKLLTPFLCRQTPASRIERQVLSTPVASFKIYTYSIHQSRSMHAKVPFDIRIRGHIVALHPRALFL